MEIEPEGAIELAKRSRGTPRLANRLLKRVRDFAQVKYDGVITKEVADFALDLIPWQQLWEKMRELWKMYMSHIF